MAIQHIGLKEINGPLVVLDDVEGASFEELVQLHLENGSVRLGRIVQIMGKRVVVQVFEGTDGLSLNNTTTEFTGHPMEIALSKEILGRIFNGAGKPIDGLGAVSYTHLDVYKRQS